ncbi:hypothetical protein, partial [Microcoleus sp. MON2_D5]|uniref:hypothetical protein n=1 Tax=Microcoleus sp. MON2_D5 TaxID=2818833 RepID=UPI002FD046C0
AKICAILTEHQAWYSVIALAEHLKLLTQILGNLLVAAKFCNGLIGVSLTDSLVTALAND